MPDLDAAFESLEQRCVYTGLVWAVCKILRQVLAFRQQPEEGMHGTKDSGDKRFRERVLFHQQLYVWESQIEVLARHLLLLRVAQDWELPIRQRANAFLEIFGNCSVQVMVFVIIKFIAVFLFFVCSSHRWILSSSRRAPLAPLLH